MFFKSMELHGFKSFPDKTVLHFDRKITAVIGSNGNGKSNISDALRWVMGEQGAKTLRGDKMEDIIFHGTTSRNSMGYAKVSLTMDNADRTLAVDSDEVVVTRKLYRSGESEYLINGEKSRLKDVNELFMGTGLGRDGYSIVGQGRVAEIVSAKPAGRREIFEEAAGVSKFLSKRAEAIKQLANAEENILRQMDIVVELESRIPALKKQVEKANAFIELDSRKKELEISVNVMEISNLNKNIAQTEEKILANKAECDYIDNDIEKVENEIESISQEKIKQQIKIDEIRKESSDIQEKISNFKSEIAVFENDISHHQRRIDDGLKQIEASKNGGIEYNIKIENFNLEIDKNNKRIAEIDQKIQELTIEFNELNTLSENENEEYKALDKAQGRLYIQLTENKVAKSQTENLLKELDEQLRISENSANENEVKAKQYSEKIKSQNKLLSQIVSNENELNNRFGGYEMLISKKKENLEKAKLEFENNQRELTMKKQRLQILTDVENNLEGYQNSVKEILRSAKKGRLSGIHGTLADIISVDSKYTVAIETALGAALQNIIVDNEEVAKRCIRHLKDSNSGRATFLPLTSVKGNKFIQNGLESERGFEGIASELIEFDIKYNGIVNYSLGRIVVVEDIDSATFIAKKYGYKFRIITLDGQIINSGGSFTGGSIQRSGGFFTRKQEIKDLSTETKNLAEKLIENENNYNRINSEFSKISVESEGFKEELQKLKEKKIIAQGELEKLIVMQDQCVNSANDVEQRRENILAQIKANNEKVQALNGEINSINSMIEKNDAILHENDEKIKVTKTKRAEISDVISSILLEKVNAEKDIERFNERISETNSILRGLETAKTSISSEIETLKEKINEINNQIQNLNSQSKTAINMLSSSDIRIRDGLEMITKLEQKMTVLRSDSREVLLHKEKFSKELARQEERKNNFQREYDKIIASLWENYELTFSEAHNLAVKLPNLNSAQAELNEIKKKISTLGNVNLSAIEEYSEVSQRYEFLSEQLSDIEKAKLDLEKLITELTTDIKSRFMNSFVDINRHFSAIFKEIFGGGTARLELSNPDDVLTSGIEIYAAPPGKLIKNLISLSGGEQTMVAATIYFAILRHRPAPFCMFDEVDAALDEVNVSKYISFLRRFSGETQLMIITHRRHTIEGCDVLYGVFMQEKGVSRLLKQDMSEIEDELLNIS